MAKVTLSTLASLTNQESAIAVINENFAAIADAIDLAIFRNGASPNTLTADLDMNGFKIINSGAAEDENDLIRIADIPDSVRGEQGEPGDDGAPGGPLSDGDYGDVVVSSSGSVWTIDSALMSAAARTFNAQTSQANMRSTGLGLGGAAVLSVGSTAGTVAAGDDSRFTVFNSTTFSADTTLGNTYNYYLHSSGSAHALTIDPQASTAITAFKPIMIYNPPSNGIVTVTRGSGVALYVNGGTTSANASMAAGAIGTLHRYDTNSWAIVGPGIT